MTLNFARGQGRSSAEHKLHYVRPKSAVMGKPLQNWNVDHFISPFVKNIGESVLISTL